MLLQRTDSLADSPQWLYELKLDGSVDLEMKRKAIEQTRPIDDATSGLALWRSDASILTWLEAL